MKTFGKILLVISMSVMLNGCRTGKGNDDCGGVYCKNPNCPIHYIRTSGDGKSVAFQVKVLDPYETRWLFGTTVLATRAELYLKISISNRPGIYWLYPLNVKNVFGGADEISGITPYTIPYYLNKKITVELLDDDSLTKEQAKVIKEASELGMILFCDGVNLYASEKKNIQVINETTKGKLGTLAGNVANVIVKQINETQFESCGHREYNLCSGTGSIFVSNPITLIDPNTGRARCDIRFHLVPKEFEE